MDNVIKRHKLMMKIFRGEMKALNIKLLVVDEHASPTSIAIQSNIYDTEALRKTLKKEFGLDLVVD